MIIITTPSSPIIFITRIIIRTIITIITTITITTITLTTITNITTYFYIQVLV
jgi:hypothetical protein